ncbi:hypothetical protein RclHR1_04030014 [Rhizophagus clarus]|uniref:Uncharacterized protein n=1 Tax=Rhizophagus clarus TaxID=94130 RepID=A0A2Z6S9G0_9GLOM|nr:hypothetical protein RclHR1_04030014 [Rhizophagus clarus]GES83553.1 hypothetical protein RCL_jg19827.t1 [Rhizophagus clarus]
MSTKFLKTHYRRGASILTPEQIEEIRCLKNKISVYIIVRDYHINKNRVSDIWDNSERLQQSGGTKPKEKSRSKSVHISELPTTQIPPLGPIQPIPVNLESSDINKEELYMLYEKIVERNIKNMANVKNILEK